MYQMNILCTQKIEDTSAFYASDMNVHTLECATVDENRKSFTPPPRDKCCHILHFLCTNVSCHG